MCILLLSNFWQPEEKILVLPSFNHALFTYYARGTGALAQMMEAKDWDQAESDLFQSDDVAFIIITYPVESETERTLLDAGFSPIFVPSNEFLYPQMVWGR